MPASSGKDAFSVRVRECVAQRAHTDAGTGVVR